MDELEGLRRGFGIALLVLVLAQPLLCVLAYCFLSIDHTGFAAAALSVGAGSLFGALAFLILCNRLKQLARARHESSAAAADRLAIERDALAQSARERGRAFEAAHAAFRGDMSGQLRAVTTSSDTLHKATDSLSRATLHMTSETTAVAVAAEDAHRQIGTVVASGQEFLATIAKIGTYAARSAEKGVEAITLTRATVDTIDELASSSDKIGTMTALISAIANQTNLLALNATIEAARAGDQGRGFAVVAGEVKSLATETTKAATLIAEMVTTFRRATDRADAAIRTTADSIEGLNQATADIAAAVDERIAAAALMARSVEKTAFNVAFVMTSIGAIERAIDETVRGMGLLRGTAREIAEQTAALSGQLERPATTAAPAFDTGTGVAEARRCAHPTFLSPARAEAPHVPPLEAVS